MKIGWIGFHYEGLLAFENILKLGYKIEIFLTLKKENLVKKSGYSNAYEFYCKKYNIPVIYVENVNNPEIASLLKKMKLDVIFVIGWGQILSSTLLKIPKYGMIGAHASLLPENKGSAPINWSIIKGEPKTGNSLIKLNPGVDEGDIIDQQEFDITPFDTCKTLYDKVAETNKIMIQKALESLVLGKLLTHPQLKIRGTVLPRRKPSDGKIDWSKNSYEIYNFIRALTEPYPGAFSYIAGEKWIIWNASLIPLTNLNEYKHGQIIGQVINNKEEACGKLIACENGFIIIHSMQNTNYQLISGYELAHYQFKSNFFTND
jgi:methionyl-tRNA formyltransferase